MNQLLPGVWVRIPGGHGDDPVHTSSFHGLQYRRHALSELGHLLHQLLGEAEGGDDQVLSWTDIVRPRSQEETFN